MDDNLDFRIEADSPTPPAASEAPAPAPIVVIEYRNRGIPSMLVPPILILVAAIGIVAYQRHKPMPAFATAVGGTAPSRGRTIAVEAPDTGSALGPIVVRTERTSVPEVEPAGPPAPAPGLPAGASVEGVADGSAPPRVAAPVEPPPVDDPPVEQAPEPAPKPGPVAVVVKPEPALRDAPGPAAAPVDPPAAEPKITKEQVDADIEREAEQKEAERRKLQALEPHLRTLELVELFQKNEANRLPFHDELRSAVRAPVAQAGPIIEALCDRHGRPTFPEFEKRVGRLLATTYGRADYKAKVEMMRMYGMPETTILDYLANTIDRRWLGTRGGPRNKDEVWVRAARLLLTMPPVPNRAQSGRGKVPRPTSSSPSSPAPVAGGRAR